MHTKPGSVRKSDSYPIASCRFVLHLHSDLAGIDGVLQDIRELIGGKVHLELWVKVKENWRDNMNYIRSFGYDEQ